jgi:hypothetical protein
LLLVIRKDKGERGNRRQKAEDRKQKRDKPLLVIGYWLSGRTKGKGKRQKAEGRSQRAGSGGRWGIGIRG